MVYVIMKTLNGGNMDYKSVIYITLPLLFMAMEMLVIQKTINKPQENIQAYFDNN